MGCGTPPDEGIRPELRWLETSRRSGPNGIAEEKYGIVPEILMENAGRSAAQILLENYPTAGTETEILVCSRCGDSFERLRVRGRKPLLCPACRSKSDGF